MDEVLVCRLKAACPPYAFGRVLKVLFPTEQVKKAATALKKHIDQSSKQTVGGKKALPLLEDSDFVWLQV